MKNLSTLIQPMQQQRARVCTTTEGTGATPFGCCNFFDTCNDGNLMSLYYRGQLGLLDWLGFRVTNECYRVVDFIGYVRPAQSQSADTAGHVPCACDNPNGIEIGSCNLSVNDFGLYGRMSDVRKIFKAKNYCATSPRYFLDGSPVADEMTWDFFFVMDQILNDLRKAVITGNATTAGQFDGINRWVKTGYDCNSLDSWVWDWAGNDLDGGAGITVNGRAVGATVSLVDALLDTHRVTNQRIKWSPLLGNQQRRVGDTIIMGPTHLLGCLKDAYTCWSVCPSRTYDVSLVKEMREFRQTLEGGLFGDGKIYLDGMEIPLLAYDWETISSSGHGDLYYLTGSIGAQRIFEGEHLDARTVASELNLSDMGGPDRSGDYIFDMDQGRWLGKIDYTNLCRTVKLWMAPRLFCMAPWAQARFQDIVCDTPLGPISPDPASSFFPMLGSFTAATCPSDDVA